MSLWLNFLPKRVKLQEHCVPQSLLPFLPPINNIFDQDTMPISEAPKVLQNNKSDSVFCTTNPEHLSKSYLKRSWNKLHLPPKASGSTVNLSLLPSTMMWPSEDVICEAGIWIVWPSVPATENVCSSINTSHCRCWCSWNKKTLGIKECSSSAIRTSNLHKFLFKSEKNYGVRSNRHSMPSAIKAAAQFSSWAGEGKGWNNQNEKAKARPPTAPVHKCFIVIMKVITSYFSIFYEPLDKDNTTVNLFLLIWWHG